MSDKSWWYHSSFVLMISKIQWSNKYVSYKNYLPWVWDAADLCFLESFLEDKLVGAMITIIEHIWNTRKKICLLWKKLTLKCGKIAFYESCLVLALIWPSYCCLRIPLYGEFLRFIPKVIKFCLFAGGNCLFESLFRCFCCNEKILCLCFVSDTCITVKDLPLSFLIVHFRGDILLYVMYIMLNL